MEDGKPLSNADFRKMIMTPRPGGPAPDLNAQAAGARKERRPRPRPPKPKPGGGDKDAEEIAGSSYRDRAAERRLGMGAGEDAAVPGGGTMGGFLGSATHAPGDFSSLSYEDSKYLGGDMDHTHLVKGLDYALLTKIRSDQASEEAAQVLGEVAEVENRGLGSSMSVPAPSGGPVFHTPLGRALHDYLFQKHQRPMVHVFPSERFLPRRMAFVFDMERSREAGEVPTTLLRAKEDCPKPQQSLQAALDASVLGRLAKIMAYTSLSGAGKKKSKKKSTAIGEQTCDMVDEATWRGPLDADENKKSIPEPSSTPKPVDDEEDIFGDVGRDYAPEIKKKEASRTQAEEVPVAERSYFGEGDVSRALETDLQPGAQPIPGSAEVNHAQAADEERRRVKEREAKRLEILAAQDADDGYAECYPSYFDAVGTTYDSEDEEDAEGGKETKYDGADDGGTGGPTATTRRRETVKQAVKEKNKVHNELKKIEGIFEEKGYKHQHAFGKRADKEKEPSAFEGGRGGPVVPSKKRRI